jgi:hypothetical protein
MSINSQMKDDLAAISTDLDAIKRRLAKCPTKAQFILIWGVACLAIAAIVLYRV